MPFTNPYALTAGWAFTVLVYLAIVVGILFAALCFMSGAYYISELSEEHTVLTRKILRYLTIFVCAAYVFLFAVDGFPALACGVGLAAHVIYFQLLRKFPFVALKDIFVILAVIAFVGTHVVWYMEFMNAFTVPLGFGELFGFFFLLVWMVPFGFLMTLTPDVPLPGAGAMDESRGGGGVSLGKNRKFMQVVTAWLGKVTGVRGGTSRSKLY